MDTQSIITILALIAAILAWVAKLRWAKEYKDAKEAQIAALKEQLQQYKDLSPIQLREYVKATQEVLGQANDELRAELEDVAKELEEARESETQSSARIDELEHEKRDLESRLLSLAEADQQADTMTQYATNVSQLAGSVFLRAQKYGFAGERKLDVIESTLRDILIGDKERQENTEKSFEEDEENPHHK